MIYTTNNSSFPDQVVPDAEKATLDYGLAVGRAIEVNGLEIMVVVIMDTLLIITTTTA